MNARANTYELMHNLSRRGINLSFDDANTLRRAQLTLHRWAEMQCGDSNNYASWSIERDEDSGIPYLMTYPHDGSPTRKCRIADREAGALRRVVDVCKRNSLHFYHQGDPRGCALYVATEPMPDHDYTRGIAC